MGISYNEIKKFKDLLLDNNFIEYKNSFDELPQNKKKISRETKTLILDSSLSELPNEKINIRIKASKYRLGNIDFILTSNDFDVIVKSTNNIDIVDWYNKLVWNKPIRSLSSMEEYFIKTSPLVNNSVLEGEYFYVSYNYIDAYMYNGKATTALTDYLNSFFIILNGNHINKIKDKINNYKEVLKYFLSRDEDEYAKMSINRELIDASSEGYTTKLHRGI